MTVSSPARIRFLRLQSLYIALATIIGVIFWAIGLQIKPLTFLIYSLCIGNLLTPLLNRLRFPYAELKFPYDWLVFLALLHCEARKDQELPCACVIVMITFPFACPSSR